VTKCPRMCTIWRLTHRGDCHCNDGEVVHCVWSVSNDQRRLRMRGREWWSTALPAAAGEDPEATPFPYHPLLGAADVTAAMASRRCGRCVHNWTLPVGGKSVSTIRFGAMDPEATPCSALTLGWWRTPVRAVEASLLHLLGPQRRFLLLGEDAGASPFPALREAGTSLGGVVRCLRGGGRDRFPLHWSSGYCTLPGAGGAGAIPFPAVNPISGPRRRRKLRWGAAFGGAWRRTRPVSVP